MASLLHDRFVPIAGSDAWDLATGARVTLRCLGAAEGVGDLGGHLGICVDWGVTPDGGGFEAWDPSSRACEEPAPAAADRERLIELLDHGCDGEPRLLAMRVSDAAAQRGLWQLTAREARRRGYVPVSVRLYRAVSDPLAEELRHRTLVLLDMDEASSSEDGPDALARAASVSPRPHVLVTIGIRRPHGQSFFVREARSAFLPSRAVARGHLTVPSASRPDVQALLARMEQAAVVAQAGRHAVAERVLREVEAALARRGAWEDAARAGLALGRLLLSRGRANASGHAFLAAAGAAEQAGNRLLMYDARVSLAAARVEDCRLTEAEGVLRALRLRPTRVDCWRGYWASSVLAECLLWQGRHGEALDALETPPSDQFDSAGDSIDPVAAIGAFTTRVQALLLNGRHFEAGQTARVGLQLAGRVLNGRAALAANLGHLRVLVASGDLGLASGCLTDTVRHARALRAPLFALRARVIWVEGLRRAGHADAAPALRRLLRLVPSAPPILGRHIRRMAHERSSEDSSRDESGSEVGGTAVAGIVVPLVRVAQREGDDRAALQEIAGAVAAHVRAGRVEFQAAHPAPATTIVSSGTGAMPRLGLRAIEAGMVIGPDTVDGVWEVAAPVRFGDRTLAALACRWPVGRQPPTRVSAALEIAAAVAAPRVESWLSVREASAQAAVSVPELVGTSESISDVRRAIARAAAAPFAVLIEGESGVGKELVARAIHELGSRRDRRFCDLNCAALPDDLLESELFGHARGAFTGALVERQGLFEAAHGGTLFLDELPDLSLRAQAKLLRVLQQQEIRRIGETFVRKVDVRLIGATNRAMVDEVAAGRFRRDLLYRLDVIRLRVPPLRERPSDVALLARHFWPSAAERAGTTARLSHAVCTELTRYAWPGNVRELQNVIAALAVAAPARGMVRPSLLPEAVTGATAVTSLRLADARREFDRRFVEVALARAGHNRTRAAAQLGLSRQGLLKLLARVGLDATASEPADHAGSNEGSPGQ